MSTRLRLVGIAANPLVLVGATTDPDRMVAAARRLTETTLLSLPDRWRHTMGVAARAAEIADTVPAADRATLVAAAWLHDIGYAPSLQDTGFHPVDGARFLLREGWSARICSLVAHHSGARFMAWATGQEESLREFAYERSPVADALTYADQTVGPVGEPLGLEDRLADTLRRHGPGSAQARIHEVRAPYLRAVADRVRRRFIRR